MRKYFLFLIAFSGLSSAEILVDISQQRLFLLDNRGDLVISYPISSSSYGEGQIENSYKTPLGNHIIKEKIGKDAEIYHDEYDSEDDHVTSRILWLEGTEEGFNKGGNVDSFYRYIYIHGTPEEGLIGEKASHGCIRMFNHDVIELFSLVKKGTKVNIVL
jgi:lipoprotein-anchoring transpeptidase ErfK/SrfK